VDPDTTRTFRLLVIPVRFSDDLILGGGGRDGLVATLTDTTAAGFTGYWHRAVRGRMDMVVTVAPTVVTDHPRTWYVSEGEGNNGFGTDPDAYPHNSRGLYEEVSAKALALVDFRAADNTGDGIADGVLLLHSSPSAPEAGGSFDRTLMRDHAWSLEEPLARGDAAVFPYAVASSFDGIGPWAHETGHLLGLPDLYINSIIAPGQGVGDWSLMATGALVGGGDTPSGLDPASLETLGLPPTIRYGALDPGEGPAVRVFRAGEETGPEYFLVERRDGSDGLAIPAPAFVVYRVDRRVSNNQDPGNPLVEVRAELCATSGACTATLDDFTAPSLRDGDGNPTGLLLRVQSGMQAVIDLDHPVPGIVLEPLRAGGSAACDPPVGETVKTWILTGRNPSAYDSVEVILEGDLCDEESRFLLGPGEGFTRAVTFSLGTLAPPIPDAEESIFTRVGVPGTADTAPRVETRVRLRYQSSGLEAGELGDFTSRSLEAGRVDPWTFVDGAWNADGIPVLGDAVLETRWLEVPAGGQLLLEHAWALAAPAPDLALDAATVTVDRQLAPDSVIAPAGGWGWTAPPNSGNNLGGSAVLAGTGRRLQVLDLAAFAGETVRLVFRVAGDVVDDGGSWRIRRAVVTGPAACAPELTFPENGMVEVLLPCGAAGYDLYAGSGPTTPRTHLGSGTASARFRDPDAAPGRERRYELVWSDSTGTGLLPASTTPTLAARAVLRPPYPNPLPLGASQTWALDLPEGSPRGSYVFRLHDLRGAEIQRLQRTFDAAGRRTVSWDGRDRYGRLVPGGVYFLRSEGPSGVLGTRTVVVVR
jgi:M6 family metalloprotease-like protein